MSTESLVDDQPEMVIAKALYTHIIAAMEHPDVTTETLELLHDVTILYRRPELAAYFNPHGEHNIPYRNVEALRVCLNLRHILLDPARADGFIQTVVKTIPEKWKVEPPEVETIRTQLKGLVSALIETDWTTILQKAYSDATSDKTTLAEHYEAAFGEQEEEPLLPT